MSSGARTCRATSIRPSGDGDGVGRPSSSSRTARGDSGRRPADLESRHGCESARGARAECPGQRCGRRLGAGGHTSARQCVRAPGQRVAAPNLNHQVRREHGDPAPEIARFAMFRSVVEALVGREQRTAAGRRGRRAACRIALLGQRAWHGGHLPAAAVPDDGAIAEPPRHKVHDSARAVGGAIESAHDHHPRLRREHGQRGLECRDAAMRRCEADGQYTEALGSGHEPRERRRDG